MMSASVRHPSTPMTSPLPEPDPTLVERVRKLLDKSQRTDNDHEAEVFARKAAELVARHRIDPEHLTRRSGAGDLRLIEIHVGRGAYVRGRLALLGNIAEAHDVRMVFRSTPTGSVAMLAGFSDELGVVEMMYTSLHQQAATKMAEISQGTGAATQRHRRAFLFGFAERLGQLLAEERSAVEAEGPTDSGVAASLELALAARNDRVDSFAEQSWGRVRSASRPSAVSPDGYENGANAAESADVGRTRLADRQALGRGT